LLLRLTKHIKTRSPQGQIAVAFVVFIALILLLATATMNLGEVARLRTSTANAADAGALAGASWVASGENEAAWIARAMWINVLITQAIFALPFCFWMCWLPVALYAVLIMVNGMLKDAADDALHAAWDNAHGAALFTAIQNAMIDDPTDKVRNEIKALSEQFEASRMVPATVRFDWVRKGAHKFPEPSWLEVNVNFTSGQPDLEMGGWNPVAFCLSPCITIGTFVCCWPMLGWGGGSTALANPSAPNVKIVLAKPWASLWGVIPYPTIGICWFCFPFPISGFGALPTTPDDIDNKEGDVIVTVRQHREGGSNLRFWTTRYPDQIVSSATAHYSGADADLWPDPDAEAQLVSVQ